jgi:hypothetical protein
MKKGLWLRLFSRWWDQDEDETQAEEMPLEGDVIELQGRPMTGEEAHWLKIGQQAPVEGIKSIEEAARQLITITGFLEGVYFAVISFTDVRHIKNDWAYLSFVLPIGLWLVCILFASLVFVPRTYPIDRRTPDSIRQAYERIVHFKRVRLLIAYWILVGSFAVLLVNVWIYLKYVPLPTAP